MRDQAVAPPTSPDRGYTVQHGDSLWKISRKFGVKIDQLRALNSLETDQLKPGTELTLPSD